LLKISLALTCFNKSMCLLELLRNTQHQFWKVGLPHMRMTKFQQNASSPTITLKFISWNIAKVYCTLYCTTVYAFD